MHIAVTGGAGFIGAATIAAAQARGHTAWSVDRDTGGNIMGDLSGLKGADAVIHLAGVLGTAELFDDAMKAVEVNVLGALNVMQWCVRNDAVYIGILMPDVFPSIYTATKIAAKRLADALHHSRGLRMAHVRAFNAYGPGQRFGVGHPQKILPTFAVHAWRRQPLPIWGTGYQTVDMIHVDDIARMLIDAIPHARGWITPDNVKAGARANLVFDGGTGQAVSVLHVAHLVAKATGWFQPDIDYLPMRDGEVESTVCADGEGWALLGWRPQFDAGLIAEAARSYESLALG